MQQESSVFLALQAFFHLVYSFQNTLHCISKIHFSNNTNLLGIDINVDFT